MGLDTDQFLDAPCDDLLCAICMDVLEDPVQCANGHCFCRACIVCHIHTSPLSQCPSCRSWMDENALIPNRFAKSMIDKQVVRCLKESFTGLSSPSPSSSKQVAGYDKCDWRGPLHSLASHHQTDCRFQAVPCPHKGCPDNEGATILRKDLPAHAETCGFQLVSCEHCDQNVWAPHVAQHHSSVCRVVLRLRQLYQKYTAQAQSFRALKQQRVQIEAQLAQFHHQMTSSQIEKTQHWLAQAHAKLVIHRQELAQQHRNILVFAQKHNFTSLPTPEPPQAVRHDDPEDLVRIQTLATMTSIHQTMIRLANAMWQAIKDQGRFQVHEGPVTAQQIITALTQELLPNPEFNSIIAQIAGFQQLMQEYQQMGQLFEAASKKVDQGLLQSFLQNQMTIERQTINSRQQK